MNKLTKLLSVFVIAGAIGTGIAGVAGCNNGGNGGGGGGHTHDYEYTVSTTDSSKHVVHCKNPGHEGGDTLEDHVDADHNDECDKCHASLTVITGVVSVTGSADKSSIKIGETATLSATVVAAEGLSKDVTWAILEGDDCATLAGNVLTATKAGSVTVQATSVADTSKKSGYVTVNVLPPSRYDVLSADTENSVIAEDFSDTTKYEKNKLPVYTDYATNNEAGLYAWGDGNSTNIADGTRYVDVSSGKAVHNTLDTGNISIIANLGNAVTGDKVIEGYVELSVDAVGNDWAVMALVGKSDAVASTAEVFSVVMSDSTGTIAYRTGGKGTEASKVVPTSVKFATNPVYEIDYKLDLVSGLIDVTITPQGGTAINLCEGVQTGITEVKTVTFVSSNGGKRHTTVDNIAINVSDLAMENLKDSLKAKLDSYVAVATVDTPNEGEDTLTLTGDDVTAAITNVKEAIDGSDSVEAAKAAYVVTDVDNAILAQARISANAILTAYRSDESFTHEGSNKDAMEKAKGDGATAIGQAETVDAVRAALKAAKEECAKVLTDDEDNAAKVDITLKLNDESGEAVGEIPQAIAGQQLSIEDLVAGLTTETYLKDIKFYEDAAHSTEITEGYTPSDQNTAVTLYVVITDADNTGTKTITVAESQPVESGNAYVTLEAATSYNAGDFKFASSTESVTLKIQAKAGQKITISTSGFTGSTGNASGITLTAENATTTDATTIDYPDTSKVTDQTTANIVYTVSADGEVTIVIKRSAAKTARVTNITIAVANAE